MLFQKGFAGCLVRAVRAHEWLFSCVFINMSLESLYAGGGVGTVSTLVHLGSGSKILPPP